MSDRALDLKTKFNPLFFFNKNDQVLYLLWPCIQCTHIFFQMACYLFVDVEFVVWSGKIRCRRTCKGLTKKRNRRPNQLLAILSDTVFFWHIKYQPINKLTKRSFWSELSDLGSSSIVLFFHCAAFSVAGGVLIL